MKPNLAASFRCRQCAVLMRELAAARDADQREMRQRIQDVAEASGRAAPAFARAWMSSVMRMPDGEMWSLLESHYPRVAEARRRKTEHESTTGHSVLVHGWWFGLFGFFNPPR